MRYKKTPIGKYSKFPKSHGMAVNKIASETGIPPARVHKLIMAFFGKYGIKYFVIKRQTISINGLGKFYFTKMTLKKFKK